MKAAEKAIRDAAAALSKAIKDGEPLGLHVAWPLRADGLDTIEISETAAAQTTTAAPATTAAPKVK